MSTHFHAVKTKLLSAFSVPLAREYLQKNTPEFSPQRRNVGESQFLVDVSVILREDARSGIQRVVRALLHQLLNNPPSGYRVRPVYATRQHGYRYADGFLAIYSDFLVGENSRGAVHVEPGDIFLGLDLVAHLLPKYQEELIQWKRNGATVHIVVYDLLPVLNPHWFYLRTTRNFHRWLKTIAIFADSLLCISESVKTELTDWLESRYGLAPNTIPIHTIALGADIDGSLPNEGLPADIDRLNEAMGSSSTVLMVGTIEPRKGHRQVLDAFEILWERACDINLLIVGKPGWKTESLQRRMRVRLQTQKRLHWLDDVSDEMLTYLYSAALGVIVASEAEGFGLPLIEAEHYFKPILARDIPVFREIGGVGVTFFSGESPESLVESLEPWLASIQSAPNAKCGYLFKTWHDSAQELIHRLGLAKGASLSSTNHEMRNFEIPQEFPA